MSSTFGHQIFKDTLFIVLTILKINVIFIFSSIDIFAQDAFSKGINLTGWFQTNNAHQIQFTKYTKDDLKNIKSLGVDVIRLPINLHSMVTNTNDYELEPLFLNFLDEVVDWAEELEIHLILDNHTFDPNIPTDPSIKNVLIPVWRNMAKHFKGRSKLIYYEVLNEPHDISDALWNSIQGDVIKAIREIDTVHTIIVGPAGFNSFNNLNAMPIYEDDNLIYTFHFYDPFIFTHQGAGWVEPSMENLAFVPFPYNQSEMPAIPHEFIDSWLEFSMNNYESDGTIAKVRELIDIASNFMEERNVPLFCGEFGVLMDNADNNDRILWYNVVRTYLELKGISWTIWDYHGSFGLFNQFGNGLFEHDLNTKLLESLGFNVPPQSDFFVKADTTNFNIYTDFIDNKISESSYNDGLLNFYSPNAKVDNFCINWFSPSRYNSIGFKFQPIRDFSFLESNNFELGFWFKGDNSSAKFDLRFIDTKISSEDHPWRMGYTLDFTNAVFNNEWNYIQIPLSSFQEYGSWDNNTWFEPNGLFDWTSIDRFEIVDEYGALNNSNLWFDEIIIFDPAITDVENKTFADEFKLHQNYPNPFNTTTIISYNLPNKLNKKNMSVKLVLYDILGRKLVTLVDNIQNPGNYDVEWNAANYPTGVYYYRLEVDGMVKARSTVLLK